MPPTDIFNNKIAKHQHHCVGYYVQVDEESCIFYSDASTCSSALCVRCSPIIFKVNLVR
jgi:hypothetical protein